MKRPFPFLSVLALTVAAASAGSAAPPTTRLSGVVADPVANAGLDSAKVRLGPARAEVGADGVFAVESSARGRKPYRTLFRAPRFLPYRSWTPVGEEVRREVFLFPAGEIAIPGYVGDLVDNPVSEAAFRDHFDAVWRDTYDGGFPDGLARWMRQPRIFIGNRVVEDVRDGFDSYWRMGDRITLRDRRRVRTLLQEYVPRLTGGLYSAGRVRWKRFRAGQEVPQDYDEVIEPGEIVIFFFEPVAGSSAGGAMLVEGREIVRGMTTIPRDYLDSVLADSFRGRTIIHELGHALGMRHGSHIPGPSVPLCSLMGNRECQHEGHISVIDEITARLAYSRMPGNNHADRDPRPRSRDGEGAPARLPARWIPFDVAPVQERWP